MIFQGFCRRKVSFPTNPLARLEGCHVSATYINIILEDVTSKAHQNLSISVLLYLILQFNFIIQQSVYSLQSHRPNTSVYSPCRHQDLVYRLTDRSNRSRPVYRPQTILSFTEWFATWNWKKEEYSGNYNFIYSSGKFHVEYSGCRQDMMENSNCIKEFPKQETFC